MMMFKLVVLCSIVTVCSTAAAPAECKSCKDAVASLFDMAQSVMAGVEPLELKDIQVCKILTVTGIKTIMPNGTPCIKPNGGTEFIQEIGVAFTTFNANCSLKSFEQLEITRYSNTANTKAAIIAVLGKKKDPPPPKSDNLLINWNNLRLHIKMRLDFEKDKFEVLSSTVTEIKAGALKINCEGDGLIMKFCATIMKSDKINDLFGLIVQYVVKHVIGIVLKTDDLKDLITMLNCGEPDPPDDE
uniref:Uncharacterized protein n=1 Tax=Strigamia maritima TaxID=126957 RepID=T1J035_STRMM